MIHFRTIVVADEKAHLPNVTSFRCAQFSSPEASTSITVAVQSLCKAVRPYKNLFQHRVVLYHKYS